jgi:hypothetical protein
MKLASRAALVTGLTGGLLSLASPASAAPHNDCYYSNGEQLYGKVESGRVVVIGAGPDGYVKARRTAENITRRPCYETQWQTLDGLKMKAEGSVEAHWINNILRW